MWKYANSAFTAIEASILLIIKGTVTMNKTNLIP